MLLVSGYAGIETALVQELYQPITQSTAISSGVNLTNSRRNVLRGIVDFGAATLWGTDGWKCMITSHQVATDKSSLMSSQKWS